jgi:hypothetical protein
MRVLSSIILAVWAVPYLGWADDSPVTVPAGTPAAASESVAATTTDPPAAEKTPAQLKQEAAEAKIRQYGVNGYKPEKIKSGDTVYCKREAPLGSRFETKQCRTFEQLRDEQLRGKEYLEQMQHVVPPNKG